MPEKINFKRGKAHFSTGFSLWSGSVKCMPWGVERGRAPWLAGQDRVKLILSLKTGREKKKEQETVVPIFPSRVHFCLPNFLLLGWSVKDPASAMSSADDQAFNTAALGSVCGRNHSVVPNSSQLSFPFKESFFVSVREGWNYFLSIRGRKGHMFLFSILFD